MIAIANILNADELQTINDYLATAEFVDGKLTAGKFVKGVKNNLQVKSREGKPSEVDQTIVNALSRNDVFSGFVLPRRFMTPLFSKYEPGMQYGSHVDSALMGTGDLMRCDVSVTVFLNDPASYEGGQLMIGTPSGERAVKLPAGAAVVYASDTLHRVAPVSSGVRLVAVTWAQSYVRDEQMRQILYDMKAASRIVATRAADSPEAKLLFKSHANLLRKVAEP